MLFNSVEFLIFLPITLAIYAVVIPATYWRMRKLFLVLASYYFYMSWNPLFGLLLAGSTLVDFSTGLALERTTHHGRRRALLALSLIFNLGLLGYFKYGAFVMDNLTTFLGRPPRAWDIVLPVAISFYTFESLSYTINVYRGERAARSLLDFALFLSFFPHLVAGPIVRPRAFLPQLPRPPVFVASQFERALARIAFGFCKKLLLADLLGQYVDAVWKDLHLYPALNVLLAFYAYAFQIYFDFSGYTDIALGVAQLFGLELPENFAHPYLARSPREFWQRWHISLSTWLRDYLYVSLGGNRISPLRTQVNLLLTMVLGGLWHGAAWTFVLWGAYHGVWLVLHRQIAAEQPAADRGRIGDGLRIAITFHLVVLGWVFFRAGSVDELLLAFSRLHVWGYHVTRAGSVAAILLPLVALLHGGPTATAVRERFIRLPAPLQGAAYALALVIGCIVAPTSERFIYFQF